MKISKAKLTRIIQEELEGSADEAGSSYRVEVEFTHATSQVFVHGAKSVRANIEGNGIIIDHVEVKSEHGMNIVNIEAIPAGQEW